MIKEYQLNLDLKPIKEFVYDLKKSTTLTAQKSNKGGFQSFIEKEWPSVLTELEVFIQKQIPDMHFTSLWYNINGTGHYNDMHYHLLEEGYSGAFYMDVPEPKKMGNIYFETGEEIEPKENTLLLFPADLKHGVRPNQSKFVRMSMSFNYLKDKPEDGVLDKMRLLKSGIQPLDNL